MSKDGVLATRAFLAIFVNLTGSWASLIGLWAFASYEYGVDALRLGVVTFAWSAPAVAAGPLVIRLLRARGPKNILYFGFVVSSLGALIMIFTRTEAQMIAAAIVFGTGRGIVNPVVDGLAVWLPGRRAVVRNNSLLHMATDTAMVAGALLSGVLLSFDSGFRAVFIVDIGTFVAAGVLLAGVPLQPAEEGPPPSERLLLANTRRASRVIFQMAGVYIVWAGYLVLEPLYVRDILNRGAVVFSLLQAVYAVGVVGASLALQSITVKKISRPVTLEYSCIAFGLAAGLYLGTSSLTISTIGVFLWGATSATAIIISRSIVQELFDARAASQILALTRGMNSAVDLAMLPIASALVLSGLGVRGTGLLVAAAPVTLAVAASAASRVRSHRFSWGLPIYGKTGQHPRPPAVAAFDIGSVTVGASEPAEEVGAAGVAQRERACVEDVPHVAEHGVLRGHGASGSGPDARIM